MLPSKATAVSLLYKIKFFDFLRYIQKSRVIILMYHRFSDKPQPFKIEQSVFENQIKFMLKKYNLISLQHYCEVLNGQRDDLPGNPAIITIDDGYWDNYVFAYPVLKKYRVPATIFLATDFISHKAWLWSNKLEHILKNSKHQEFDFSLGEKTTRFKVNNFANWHTTQLAIFNHCKKLPNEKKDAILRELAVQLKVSVPEQTRGDFQPLNWEQIREMSGGGIDFGSHTCSHPILSRLSNGQLEFELAHSKAVIEKKASCKVDLLCYPNGSLQDINDSVIRAAKQAGYKAAVTTVAGLNDCRTASPFLLKRNSVLTDNPASLLRTFTRLN